MANLGWFLSLLICALAAVLLGPFGPGLAWLGCAVALVLISRLPTAFLFSLAGAVATGGDVTFGEILLIAWRRKAPVGLLLLANFVFYSALAVNLRLAAIHLTQWPATAVWTLLLACAGVWSIVHQYAFPLAVCWGQGAGRAFTAAWRVCVSQPGFSLGLWLLMVAGLVLLDLPFLLEFRPLQGFSVLLLMCAVGSLFACITTNAMIGLSGEPALPAREAPPSVQDDDGLEAAAGAPPSSPDP